MSNGTTRLQVLLVEDEPEDLRQYERDFPSVFSSCQVEADIHSCESFDEAFAWTSNPLYRYDLIISDTYKGPHENRDAQVMKMVKKYRGNRFCPLVVYSSGVKPVELKETAFIVWADKSKSGDIERAINQLLDTNIPQLARKLHDELERSAGSYLWEFLEKKWNSLQTQDTVDPGMIERLIRRRAAMQLGRLNPTVDDLTEIEFVEGIEFYICPPVSNAKRLGDIFRSKVDNSLRVVLTPHCHLAIQPGEGKPRADYVLTVKAFPFHEVMSRTFTGENGIQQNPWPGGKKKKLDILRRRIQSPADLGKPKGRYWFMPSFLDIIPQDMFCDFLQIESVSYKNLETDFKRIAVLDSPFAEALQSCFTKFYSTVGILNLLPEKFKYLIKK